MTEIEKQLDAAESDARRLVLGLSETHGSWRVEPGSWSIAECLDHLAVSNRLYLAAMLDPALRAREAGRIRRSQARPGWIGRWFVRSLEPPVKRRFKAPRLIRPRPAPPFDDAFERFLFSQNEVRSFVRTYGDLDLASIRFRNPFIRGVRFSLATGLHVIPAHERRHLWQAWRIRRAAEAAAK
jgi:DinB superfamily